MYYGLFMYKRQNKDKCTQKGSPDFYKLSKQSEADTIFF
jgi:hypothetical protein